MPRKEAVVVIDGNLIFGRTREGEFAARGGEGIEFEEFSGRNEIKNPSWLFERPGNRDFEKSVGREENCKLNLSILTSFKESF